MDEKSVWFDPALYLSLAALGLSLTQWWRSERARAQATKRTAFIEYLSVHFSLASSALSSLEVALNKARRQRQGASDEILSAATTAMRTVTTSLNLISESPSVRERKIVIDTDKFDDIDIILSDANDEHYDGVGAKLYLKTAQKIVTELSDYLTKMQIEIQKQHL